jgi:hypothetical protein
MATFALASCVSFGSDPASPSEGDMRNHVNETINEFDVCKLKRVAKRGKSPRHPAAVSKCDAVAK